MLCINEVGVAYISDKVTSLWRILSDIMAMKTIRRLDVNAVLLRTKSSKPSTENIRDERVYVYITFKFHFELRIHKVIKLTLRSQFWSVNCNCSNRRKENFISNFMLCRVFTNTKKLKEKDHVRRNKFLENSVKMNLSRNWIW